MSEHFPDNQDENLKDDIEQLKKAAANLSNPEFVEQVTPEQMQKVRNLISQLLLSLVFSKERTNEIIFDGVKLTLDELEKVFEKFTSDVDGVNLHHGFIRAVVPHIDPSILYTDDLESLYRAYYSYKKAKELNRFDFNFGRWIEKGENAESFPNIGEDKTDTY